jgi:ABC-type multidrug transport system fused ATPase/permease subunit
VKKLHFASVLFLSLLVQIILALFGIINSLLTLGRAFSFAFGGLCAAVHIHGSLLENIISAPVCFFDQNPSGRILNRLAPWLHLLWYLSNNNLIHQKNPKFFGNLEMRPGPDDI